MLFKSATVTSASGSVGGITASHNKGGMYFRARTIPTNPNSPAQMAARLRLQQFSQRWVNDLSPEERDAWNAYAPQIEYVNALGDPIQVSGQNLYIASNTVLDQCGGTIVDAAPSFTGQPGLNVTVDEISAPTTISLDVGVTGNAWAAEDGAYLAVYSSRNISPGRSFFKGPYRFAGAIAGDSTTPATGAQSVISPFTLNADDKCFIRVRVVTADGRLSLPWQPGGTVIG